MTTTPITNVILVDDNPDDLFLNSLVVKRSKLKIAAKEFDNPISALSYLAKTPSDGLRIVLLDINMPYLDGFAFLDRYQETCKEHGANDRIAMLTTSMHSVDCERARANPLVRSYLRKPLTVQSFNQLLDDLAVD